MQFFVWLEQSSVGIWVNGSSSVWAYPTVLLLHTIGLTLLVGINMVIALRILGLAPQIAVAELEKLFPLVWVGLAINATTGLLLLAAKATQVIVNPAFYIKMTSIGLAIAVFFAIRNKVFRDPLVDQRPMQMNSKFFALLSIFLWLVAITAGRLLAYFAEATEFAARMLN